MKGKKTALFTLVMLVSLSIPTAFSKNDNFGVDYIFTPVMTEGLCDGCGNYMIEDTRIYSVPGEPLVPYRAATILLPQGAVVKDVKVKHGKPIVMKGYDLPWGQPPCTFSDEPVKVGRNEKTYGSNNPYPSELFEVIGVEYFRGYAILNVHLFPVQYMPKSGQVKFYRKLTVDIQFGKGMKNKLYRGLEKDKAAVAGMVDNVDTLSTYEGGAVPLATEEYIIITNDTMQSTFQDLANWKASYVNGASVYTVSWITSNYSGVDNQDKIRNFIIDKYTNNGTLYVLMGGDVAAVPYRGFYVSTGGYTDSDMLADMYFGHLDGNHNSDGDTRYGETNDNVDFTAEVAVGRAPCQSTVEAQAFVDKVIDYEQMDKLSRKRVLLHQSRVQSGNSPDSRCLAFNCDDWIPGDYYIDYLFEENGTVTKAKWRTAWDAGPIVVVHIGHGNTTVYYINYEVGGTVSWYCSDVFSMTNTFWPWHTSTASSCGNIKYNDCLAEQYVMADCGAIACIMNGNYQWFSTLNACQYSGEFCEMEVRACWSDGYEKLGDLLNKAKSYLASSAQSNSTYRWCFYERNLVGDPETPCLTKRNGEPTPDEEYIIITNDTMKSAFQRLAGWKANFVNGTGVYTVNWIYSHYPGVDNPEKIRNFIIDKYTNNGTKYILLGGDVDTVPYRGFYASTGGYTESDLPADMYYACLDGNHNADGDSRWGETNDNVDFIAEVAVGRAPVETIEEAQAFVYKVIDYEQAEKPKRVVLHQARLNPLNDPDSRCLAWNCDDWIPPDYTIDYLFEENGPISMEDWINAWASNPLIFSHMGNGDTDWIDISYGVRFTNEDVSLLTNTFWPLFTSPTSFAGDFRANDCLAEELVKDTENGAIAALTNASYFWYSENDACQYSGEFVESFFRALFRYEHEKLGHMLNKGKSYLASSAQSDSTYRWCYYAFNLIGDPETPILTQRGVSCTVPIGAYCDGADSVKFYIDGVLKYEDTTAPFIYYWDTCPYSDGGHTITIEGYASGALICDDTFSYRVDHYYVRITNPQEGETVSGTVPIIVDANCVDTVEFYIDGVLKYAKTLSEPHEGEIIQYNWNTYPYPDGGHTITVKGYETGDLKREVSISVAVINTTTPVVIIINPSEGQTVFGTVTCAAGSNCDSVKWYIDGSFSEEDQSTPFQYSWDTTLYSDGDHTVKAEGYNDGVYQCEDSVTCNVDNTTECLGTTLLFLFLVFGSAKFFIKR